LPLILVVSALTVLLYYWRVLPVVVRLFAKGLEKSLGISGAGGVAAAANVFVGMIEAPLFIKPYMAKLSRSELFLVMTTGMATIAGTVLVLYASFLSNVIPDPAGHLLMAPLLTLLWGPVEAIATTVTLGTISTVQMVLPELPLVKWREVGR